MQGKSGMRGSPRKNDREAKYEGTGPGEEEGRAVKVPAAVFRAPIRQGKASEGVTRKHRTVNESNEKGTEKSLTIPPKPPKTRQ